MNNFGQNLNKNIMVKNIRTKLNISVAQATALFDAIIEVMTESLVNGEDLKVAQFGSFSVNTRPERVGRNPNTGEQLMIKESTNTYFKASSIMHTKLNKNNSNIEEDFFF